MARQNKKNKSRKEKKQKRLVQAEASSSQVHSIEMQPKIIIEEKLKVFLAVILFFLFLLLFGSVVWYLLTQLDTTFVNGTGIAHIFSFLS